MICRVKGYFMLRHKLNSPYPRFFFLQEDFHAQAGAFAPGGFEFHIIHAAMDINQAHAGAKSQLADLFAGG